MVPNYVCLRLPVLSLGMSLSFFSLPAVLYIRTDVVYYVETVQQQFLIESVRAGLTLPSRVL